jgi:hypothetical protein
MAVFQVCAFSLARQPGQDRLTPIVASLQFIVAGAVDALLGGIHDGQQLPILPQR